MGFSVASGNDNAMLRKSSGFATMHLLRCESGRSGRLHRCEKEGQSRISEWRDPASSRLDEFVSQTVDNSLVRHPEACSELAKRELELQCADPFRQLEDIERGSDRRHEF